MSNLHWAQSELMNYLDTKDYPYKELLENFTEAIYVISLQGHFLDFNRGFTKVLGPREKLLNTPFLDIVHPDDKEIARRGFIETIEGITLKEVRLRIFASCGEIRTIVTSNVPIIGKEGQTLGILGIAVDITVEIQLQSQIEKQNNKFKSLLKNSNSVSCILSDQGEVTYRSPSLEKVLGYKPSEGSQTFLSFIHPDDMEHVQNCFDQILVEPDQPQIFDVRLRHKNGNWRMVHVESHNLLDDPDINGIIVNYHDVTDVREAQHEVHYMAYHDYLTGLPNRRYFEEQLENELQKAKAYHQKVAVFFIDIDRFKFINDTLGHDMGDQVLIKVADMLKSFVSDKGTVARMAGDEFMMYVSTVRDSDDAENIATSILKKMQEPIIINDYELFVTGSIGISLYPDSGEELSVLMKNSDLAMYVAKERKENSYTLFNPVMEKATFKNFSLQNELRKANYQKEFELYYQPKVSSKTRQIVGTEALIRWNHPTLGTLAPGEFIPLAEESGLIVSLGEWVFRQVCKQIRTWKSKGFPPIVVSLNFSALQMLQKGLVETVASILTEHQVDGKWIEIEITESLILENDGEMVNKLEALKELGIHIAIDDFGTGFSSLSYLKKYKFNTIKLDKSFINDIHTSQDNKAIIEFIINLSNQLQMKVVAEGVEHEEQLAILQKLNCDELQGYLFSRPQPLPQFEKLWLRDLPL
ncbi:sensor domain-containing protein [Halalkalibacter okhensis]|uniref:sensor domain-containing protein n=1 Tax=Halalkalibacter okhensis TaxID=333138 RepID=UPI000691A7F9|nr:EAL domain-containing protein [Halalkalibacter okhensis]